MTRLIAALILLFCTAAMAAAEDTARASIGDSELIAGGEAVLESPVRGNAFAAGRRVEVRERVEKSAFVSGRDLYAAGGTIRLSPGARIDEDAGKMNSVWWLLFLAGVGAFTMRTYRAMYGQRPPQAAG